MLLPCCQTVSHPFSSQKGRQNILLKHIMQYHMAKCSTDKQPFIASPSPRSTKYLIFPATEVITKQTAFLDVFLLLPR